MAKTAVFTKEAELLGVYSNGKAAKAAHPEHKEQELEFMTEKEFEPFGSYETAEQVFGVKKTRTPRLDADGNPFAAVATRVVRKLDGEYVVVKADGVRFNDDDERSVVHAALIAEPHTFCAFLARAPERYTFTTGRGRAATESASVWARYALRRGWIRLAGEEAATADDEAESAATVDEADNEESEEQE